MNIGVHASFQIWVFSKYMPRSRIAGSYARSNFNFLRNCHTVFHSGCTSLHSHKQYRSITFSPHPLRHLFIYLKFGGIMCCWHVGLEGTYASLLCNVPTLSPAQMPSLLSDLWSLVHTDYCYKFLVPSNPGVFTQCLCSLGYWKTFHRYHRTVDCSKLRETVSLPTAWTPL